MLVVPVRHHSPAAALQIERELRARRPALVLVEGPSDANELITYLTDRGTAPPVAIYAYRTDLDSTRGHARAVYYPLCAYSPEYVALRIAAEIGAEARFCDVPAAVTLGWDGDPPDPVDLGGESVHRLFSRLIVEASGHLSFDAWWEAEIEQTLAVAPFEQYRAALHDYGDKIRRLDPERDTDRDARREAHMARAVLDAVAAGTPPERIAVVCGAAHAQPIRELVERAVEAPELAAPVPAQTALIAYSFPRLSEQLGYGAGNRAPWYYQRVWEERGDYAAASRHAIVSLARELRGERRTASAQTAQAIDADRLAHTLALMRGKDAPGVDEVTDAAAACFGEGKEVRITSAASRVLIGEAIGRVTQRAGRSPLQREFLHETERLRLPVVDASKQILVHLTSPLEAEQSILLRRLVTADIPYASELQTGIAGRGRASTGGSLEQLGRVLEKWDIRWTPATDGALVEQGAWGATIAEVCQRLLSRRLAEAQRVDEGTSVLLGYAVCDLMDEFETSLARCDALAADSGSFPALARASFHLDGLLSFGAVRKLPLEELESVRERLFTRAAVQLPLSAICGDNDAAAVESGLLPLVDIARRSHIEGVPLLWERIDEVAGMERAHPRLRGLALSVLQMNGKLGSGELVVRLRSTMHGREPSHDAHVIGGLFTLHRATLVRTRDVIEAVTDYLLTLDIDALIPLLPSLRRGLGGLSRSERAYLTETLTGVLDLPSDRPAQLPALSEVELARVREADLAVAKILDEWRERYGIG